MNKNIFFTVLLFSGAISIFAQKKDTLKLVSFDFDKPAYPSNITLKPRQGIELQLKNYNPNVYEISINDSLLVYPNSAPSLFTDAFKVPDLKEIASQPEPASEEAIAAASEEGMLSREQEVWVSESKLQDPLTKFVNNYHNNGVEKNFKDFIALKAIPTALAILLEDCSLSSEKLKEKADEYLRSKLTINTAILPLDIHLILDKKLRACNDSLNSYQTKAKSLKSDYEKILADAKGISVEEYKKLEKDIKNKVVLLDDILANLATMFKELAAFNTTNLGNSINGIYSKIGKKQTISYFVSTKYNTDEVLLKIKIKPKGEAVCTNRVNSFNVTGIVKGAIKIDFSLGVAFNMGSKYFFDQKYYYNPVYRTGTVLADSFEIKRKENRNIVTPSLGAFMHIYPKGKKQVKGGGVVGVSMGTDQKMYYHLGGCLLLGQSDRLVISGGLSIAKATVIDGQYHDGQILGKSLAPETIPTENVTRIGAFLSLSWNLGLIK